MRIEPPLLAPEMDAICKHFGSDEWTQPPIGGGPAERVGGGSVVPCFHGIGPVSYRAFLAWIDPVDVGRVAKR